MLTLAEDGGGARRGKRQTEISIQIETSTVIALAPRTCSGREQRMFRFAIALLFLLLPVCGWAQVPMFCLKRKKVPRRNRSLGAIYAILPVRLFALTVQDRPETGWFFFAW